MKLNSCRIAALAMLIGAASAAHADASAYSESNVYTTWYNAGPDIVVNVSTSSYSSVLDYWAPNFGVYSTTPYLNFDTNNIYGSLFETAYGNSAGGWYQGLATIYFIYDNSTNPEYVTFYSTGYASGDTALSSPSDIAGYNSLAGIALQQGPNEGWVDYTLTANWDTGYLDSSYAVTDTILVQPGQDTFFESVAYQETVTYSTDSRSAPGPLGALTFGVGLVWRSRRALRR